MTILNEKKKLAKEVAKKWIWLQQIKQGEKHLQVKL
jgi:hypothetical protein